MGKEKIEELVSYYLKNDDRHSSNLKHYILRFFLTEKKIYNITHWEIHHNDFIRWLDSVQQLKNKDKMLSLGTKRNCLAALNSFYKWLSLKGVMDLKRI